MSNSKAVSIRIPDELLAKIDLLAEEKYKSHKGTPNRSLVILDAVVAYFDTLSDTKEIDTLTVLDSVSISEFNKLQSIVYTLSDSVSQLMRSHESDPVKTIKLTKNPAQCELPVLTVSDSIINPEPKCRDTLTVSELAQRFGIEPRNLGSRKSQFEKKGQLADFTIWSQEKDPDGYGWEYKKGSKFYHRVKPLA